MKLWTIQPVEVINEIEEKGYYITDKEKIDNDFITAYNWITDKMKENIRNSDNIEYPLWAWHTYDGKRKQPDLRNSGYAEKGTKMCCIEFEIQDDKVMLSEFDEWHIVLNDGYGFDNELWDKKYEHILTLSEEQQEKEKIKSWENVIIHKKEDVINKQYIQALIGGGRYNKDYLTGYLQEISEKLDLKKWYFGHYHDNKQVNEQFVLLYEDIVPLEFKSIFE